MTVITDWSIEIPIEEVFQAEQMDMRVIQQRRPGLYDVTVQAARDAQAAVTPAVILVHYAVQRVERSRMVLEGGYQLSSRFVARRLAGAQQLAAVVCTVGSALEKLIAVSMAEGKTAYAFALDAAGCVALNHLANQVYRQLEDEAEKAGQKVSARYGPGIHSWPITVGQPQLFALLPEAGPYVELTPSMQMLPLKSNSFVVGIGANVPQDGSECDDCDAREHCAYRRSFLENSQPAAA